MFQNVDEMLNTLTDEEIAYIGRELDVDYSHASWKEAKYMICEDYIFGFTGMKKFQNDMTVLATQMEDIARALTDDDEVKDYFVKYYSYDSEIDDPLAMVVQYLQDMYW